MAPWPDRLGPQRPTGFPSHSHRPQPNAFAPLPPSQPFQAAPADTRSNPRPPAPSRASPPGFGAPSQSHLQLHLQGESSSSDEGLHPSRVTSRPRHNRSMSHPFPSLFSSSKKKKSARRSPDLSGSDSADDVSQMSKSKRSQPLRVTKDGGASASPSGKEFTTGNCMTCGTLVRWPRELQVFRCSICLTINDIEPLGVDGGREDAREGGRSPDDRVPPANVHPISLEHTKSLVERCLRAFLRTSLLPHGLDAADSRAPQESTLKTAAHASPVDAMHGQVVSESALPIRPKPPAVYVSNSLAEGMEEPTLLSGGSRRASRSYSTSFPEGRSVLHDMHPRRVSQDNSKPLSNPEQEVKRIFKPLEDYIANCFTSFESLNASFADYQPTLNPRPGGGGGGGGGGSASGSGGGEVMRRRYVERRKETPDDECPIINLDPKLLLLGDVAENGSWWTGGQKDRNDRLPRRAVSHKKGDSLSAANPMRHSHINWAELSEWHTVVLEPGRSWPAIYHELIGENSTTDIPESKLQELEAQILVGQEHVHRLLLKASEMILKRPGRIPCEPYELRFILIIAANPLLHAWYKPFPGFYEHTEGNLGGGNSGNSRVASGPASGRHSGIIKRILGLLSNTPVECHNQLITWFTKYPESRFVQLKDLVSGFLAYRLIRQNDKKLEVKVDVIDGLIPSMSAGRSPATLHAALGQRAASGPGSAKKAKEPPKKVLYQDDWQIKAASQVLAFLFAANNSGHARPSLSNPGDHHDSNNGSNSNNSNNSTKDRVRTRGQVLATSDFYTTLLDDSDLVADFEAWERKRGKFSFCQYPFLLSIGAKIQILEYDARRQMQSKARDAFFDSILTRRPVEQLLMLHIRRDCLVEDSLKAVSEVVGTGGEDIKKGLRIVFTGEEGVDAGGLRKEWFLLLVREVFNPDHGLFVYDEDSQYCYFNPNSLEPSEQFFLVGVVFGLAIYNSTILDVAFPPFAFRKLLMAAPPPNATSSSSPAPQMRPAMTYTLDDLAEYRPRLASGLRQLLEFDGDVEETFCLDFAIDVDKYGAVERVPLCPGGARRAVTNANRREYVDLYVRYALDTAVARQFEPFKRGFFTVCGGNALSLFRPEEIELLVRGSDEPLNIAGLKVVASYENWGARRPGEDPAESEPTLRWFWESFERAAPADQRRLLAFITGSDRIPAMGAASLSIRVSCLGDDCGRFPTARTCFNVLALWRCRSRERLESVLWTAVNESEGFGLK